MAIYIVVFLKPIPMSFHDFLLSYLHSLKDSVKIAKHAPSKIWEEYRSSKLEEVKRLKKTLLKGVKILEEVEDELDGEDR